MLDMNFCFSALIKGGSILFDAHMRVHVWFNNAAYTQDLVGVQKACKFTSVNGRWP